MRGHTHLLLTGSLYKLFYGLPSADELSLVGVLLLGSISPDIDSEYSLIGRYTPIGVFATHRGFFHTLLCGLLISAFISIWGLSYGIYFAAGYLIHLALDTLTPAGIKWFWPLGRTYSVIGFRTGGIEEAILALAALGFIFG
jgi:inner membrane protein